MNPDNRRLIAIYLRDHLAGAVLGYELAKRALSSNRDNELGRYLEETFIPAVLEDKKALEDIMALFDVSPSAPKNALSWSGEKLGRLKLNGSFRAYSPLSRVVDLEGLVLGVRGKLSLWENLQVLAASDRALASVDLGRLALRAETQLNALKEHKLAAAERAFTGQKPNNG
jgi:hypothetical protein